MDALSLSTAQNKEVDCDTTTTTATQELEQEKNTVPNSPLHEIQHLEKKPPSPESPTFSTTANNNGQMSPTYGCDDYPFVNDGDNDTDTDNGSLEGFTVAEMKPVDSSNTSTEKYDKGQVDEQAKVLAKLFMDFAGPTLRKITSRNVMEKVWSALQEHLQPDDVPDRPFSRILYAMSYGLKVLKVIEGTTIKWVPVREKRQKTRRNPGRRHSSKILSSGRDYDAGAHGYYVNLSKNYYPNMPVMFVHPGAPDPRMPHYFPQQEYSKDVHSDTASSRALSSSSSRVHFPKPETASSSLSLPSTHSKRRRTSSRSRSRSRHRRRNSSSRVSKESSHHHYRSREYDRRRRSDRPYERSRRTPSRRY